MKINRIIVTRNMFGEYVCRMYNDKTRVPDADYFAMDKQDAYDTAMAVLEKGKNENQIIVVKRDGLAFYLENN